MQGLNGEVLEGDFVEVAIPAGTYPEQREETWLEGAVYRIGYHGLLGCSGVTINRQDAPVRVRKISRG
jgi:hypothetical protein